VRSALPTRTGHSETSPGADAPTRRVARRRSGSEADRRIDAAQRRLKATIPAPGDE
jgi:hypothetical protein